MTTDNGKQALTPRPDELRRLLEARIRKQRPSKWKAAMLLLVLFAVPLGVFIWLFWPTPPLPRVLIIAPDVLVVDDEEPTLRAVILPEETDATLGGWPVVFQQGEGSSKPTWQVEALTDANGEVSSRITAEATGTFCAIYAPQNRRRRAIDLGRVFRFSRDETPLFVAADTTLADAEPQEWQKNIFDIPARKGAAEALADLVGRKLRIVYFMARTTDFRVYLKIRNWLRKAPDPGEVPFPDGPVLAGGAYASAGSENATLAFAETCREKFARPPLAVVADGKAAQSLQKAGWSVVVLSGEGGQAAGGFARVRSWSQVSDWVSETINRTGRKGQ